MAGDKKKISKKKRIFRAFLFAVFYTYLLQSFWDNKPSFQRGSARGAVIAVTGIVLFVQISIVYKTKKSGSSWRVVLNEIRNFWQQFLSY